MRRHFLVAVISLGSLAPFGRTARADDSPLPPAVEAVRQSLIGAFVSVHRVLRAYRVEIARQPSCYVELFRQADRQGVLVVREGASQLLVSNGSSSRIQAPPGLKHSDVGVRAIDASWQRFRQGVLWLGALWDVPVVLDEHLTPGFAMGVVDGDDGKQQFSASIEWRTRTQLSWLELPAFREAQVSRSGTLVLVETSVSESAFHCEDGFPARSSGIQPRTGDSWSFTELPPTRTAEEWVRTIDEACAGPDDSEAVLPGGALMRSTCLLGALVNLRRAVPELVRRPERLGIAAGVLARTAFLDRECERLDERGIETLEKWAETSYADPANRGSSTPGARLWTRDERTKRARGTFVDGVLKQVLSIVEDLESRLTHEAGWPAEDSKAMKTALLEATRAVLTEFFDAHWLAK